MTRHSANAYKNGTCVCEVCRSAHTNEKRLVRRARYAAREDIDGTLIAVAVPEENHGRASTYRNYGCRCESCGAAESAKTVERRKREAAS
jgi:hypothetical protein